MIITKFGKPSEKQINFIKTHYNNLGNISLDNSAEVFNVELTNITKLAEGTYTLEYIDEYGNSIETFDTIGSFEYE